MMMEWKPDKQYPDEPESHTVKNSILGALFLAIMVLMVIGTIWIALLVGVGK